MLKLFRQRKLLIRALLFVIVGLVGFMMVVTLVPGLGGGGAGALDRGDVLARIGNEVITQAEVDREFRRQSRVFGESELFRDLVMERVVDSLIQERVVEYEANRIGIEVPPEELALALREIAVFYPGGKFVGAEQYRRIIETQYEMSVPEFEGKLRRNVQASRLFNWLTGGLTVSQAEIEQAYRRRVEQVQFEYALVSAGELGQRLRPSEKELRQHFEKNKDRYLIPERRAVRTVLVDEETLRGRLTVSPRELQAYYEAHRQDYWVPEQVRVRQILFLKQAPAGAAPRNPEELRKTVDTVLAEVRRGKDFAALAREHSDDQTSREKGGELGWVRRGQAVAELDQKLFSMPPGSTEVVETSYGFHLVQVLERTAQRTKPLAEVQGEIETILKTQKVRERSHEEARQLAEAARGGKPLEQAARELNWTVQEPPPFSRGELTAPFGDSTEFQDWVFRQSPESPDAVGVSEPIAVLGGYVVAQLSEVLPGHPAAFEEVRDRVEQAYRQERGAQLARETAEKLAAEAKASGDLRRAARPHGLEVQTAGPLTRDASAPELGPMRNLGALFSLPAGAVSDPVAIGDNRVVAKMLARQEADPSRISPWEENALREGLLQEKRGLTYLLFIESLEKRLKAEGVLEINETLRNKLLNKS